MARSPERIVTRNAAPGIGILEPVRENFTVHAAGAPGTNSGVYGAQSAGPSTKTSALAASGTVPVKRKTGRLSAPPSRVTLSNENTPGSAAPGSNASADASSVA